MEVVQLLVNIPRCDRVVPLCVCLLYVLVARLSVLDMLYLGDEDVKKEESLISCYADR